MLYIRQGATHKVLIGPVVAVGDGFTPVTNLALNTAHEAEVILHDNGSVVDISGYTMAAINDADGYYHLTLDSGITATIGHMTVLINNDDLCLPVRADFTVLEEAVYDAMYAPSAAGPQVLAAGTIDNATFAADVGSTAYATNIIALAVRKALDEIKLDHLVAVADADDVVDNSIIAKLTSKSGTADWSDFVNTTDSLQAIADKIIAASPQAHAAGSSTDTTGTIDSGTYADTATSNSTYWQISPAGAAVGGFGLNVQLHFDIGTGLDRIPGSVNITGYFDAITVRDVEVWAYNYNTTTWDQLSNSATHMDGVETSSQNYQYTNLTADHVQTSDGEVLIRFTATSTTTGDDLYLDYVSVGSVAVEAAGLTADAIQQAVWAQGDNGHDEDTLGYNLSKMHLVNGDIVSATDATRFVIDFDIPTNDIYNGMLITIEDKTDDHYEVRRIVDTIAASDEIVVDRAFGFTPVAGDDYYIMNAAYSDVNVVAVDGTAARATDLAEIAQYLFQESATLSTILATNSVMAQLMGLSGSMASYSAATDSLESLREVLRSFMGATWSGTDTLEAIYNAAIDKAGYSLASTGLDLVTAWTTDITGNLSGSVGSVTGHTAQTGDTYAAVGVAGVGLTAIPVARIADAIWDELLAGHTTADTAGLLLNEWQDGGRLDLILDSITNTGTGARSVTITVDDGVEPTVLENATVRFTEGGNTYLGQTSALGVIAFSLDDATYAVTVAKAGYGFTPTTLVVDGTETQTYSMSATTITAPPNASTTTGVMTVYDEEGSVESGVEVHVQITVGPGTAGIGYDSTVWTETSSAFGVVNFAGIILGATYNIWRGDARSKVQTFTAPTTGTSFNLTEIIGKG